jgi:hypothetical protein
MCKEVNLPSMNQPVHDPVAKMHMSIRQTGWFHDMASNVIYLFQSY